MKVLMLSFTLVLIIIIGCASNVVRNEVTDDLQETYPILKEGKPHLSPNYDELTDYKIIDRFGDFEQVEELTNCKIKYESSYEFHQGDGSKIGFYCTETGEKAKSVKYQSHSSGKNVEGGGWFSSIVDCGDVYLIAFTSDAGMGPVYGPFDK